LLTRTEHPSAINSASKWFHSFIWNGAMSAHWLPPIAI
jgi:hypothetical protein